MGEERTQDTGDPVLQLSVPEENANPQLLLAKKANPGTVLPLY